MSKYTFTESNYEQAIIELFRDQLGYEYIYGPDIERDYAEPLFLERLQQSLLAINPSLPEVAIHEAIEKIRQIDTGSLVQRNEVFTDYLQNGVDVAYFDGKNQLPHLVRYIQDNPRRLALKRANKDLFRIRQNQQINTIQCTVLGNIFLIEHPLRQVLQCSRRLTQEQIDNLKADCLREAADGTIYVTAAISEGEKQIACALREAGFPLIILLEKGFPAPDDPHYNYFKPQGVYFEACAAGKLLLIEPRRDLLDREDIATKTEAKVGHIPHDSQRYRFVAMNILAEDIVNNKVHLRTEPQGETKESHNYSYNKQAHSISITLYFWSFCLTPEPQVEPPAALYYFTCGTRKRHVSEASYTQKIPSTKILVEGILCCVELYRIV